MSIVSLTVGTRLDERQGKTTPVAELVRVQSVDIWNSHEFRYIPSHCRRWVFSGRSPGHGIPARRERAFPTDAVAMTLPIRIPPDDIAPASRNATEGVPYRVDPVVLASPLPPSDGDSIVDHGEVDLKSDFSQSGSVRRNDDLAGLDVLRARMVGGWRTGGHLDVHLHLGDVAAVEPAWFTTACDEPIGIYLGSTQDQTLLVWSAHEKLERGLGALAALESAHLQNALFFIPSLAHTDDRNVAFDLPCDGNGQLGVIFDVRRKADSLAKSP